MALLADSAAISRALKLLEPYTRGSKAWFEDAEEAWVRGTLVQRTDDETLGIGRLVFVRDDTVASTTSLVVAQTTAAAAAAAAEGADGSLDGSLDDLARQVARGSRLTGGRLSSLQRVGSRFVVDVLFGELAEPGADAALLPPLSNPAILDGAADLTTLSYLHEPAVLYNLRRRYEQRQIYTYSGVVLVAMNPFDPVDVYSAAWMQRYARAQQGDGEPHLFAIAESAYRGMAEGRQNQTIIVYGESGSGKTTSAKYIMRYFAQAHQGQAAEKEPQQPQPQPLSSVEAQILATNPVFESFGNAKTTRNDNSSRFGKFLDIKFDRQRPTRIVGGRIRTFLLERSRVAYQPATERNYHIFYQLLAGASDAQRRDFALGGAHASWQAFHYTRQGGGGSGEVGGVDDRAEFAETDRSLGMVGVDAERRSDIWRTLAGILHLGNVGFAGSEAAGSYVEPPAEQAFATAARLLGVDAQRLRQWLTKRQIVTRHDRILAKVARAQALVIRDSIAKFLYARLFDWLLGPVNRSLLGDAAAADQQQTAFVGVLDIYGFEHFAVNYANEKLQQNFNHHVFKLEQDEYQREQLASWTFVGFQDNQPCIDLIEGRLGVLALLDEESRLEQGSDRKFTEKLCRHYGAGGGGAETPAAAYFAKPRFSNSAFTVRHYAHDVTYEGDGFLEKNKDTVPDEIRDVLADSAFGFVAALAAQQLQQASPGPGQGRRQAPTLAGVFKRSLGGLLATLGETTMHYIRCIKPNEAKAAWRFSAPMVLAQLRSCGVIETIRISKAGYPSRVPMRTFNERYAVVLGPGSSGVENSGADDERVLCQRILDCCLPDASQYQVGLTKVFLRAGQWAIMEKRRSLVFEKSALLIQALARRVLVQRAVDRMRAAARCIQRAWRRVLFVRRCEMRRRVRAVRVIEAWWRGVCEQRWRAREEAAAGRVQALARGCLARRRVSRMRVVAEQERLAEMQRRRAEAEAEAEAEERRLREEAARAEQQMQQQRMQTQQQQQQTRQHLDHVRRDEGRRFPAAIRLDEEPDEPAAYDEYMAQVPSQLRSLDAHADALARLTSPPPQSATATANANANANTPEAARRRRTAEARASLIAAGTASRTSEAGLGLRPLAHSNLSSASIASLGSGSASATANRNTFGFHDAAASALQLIPEDSSHQQQQLHQQQQAKRPAHRHHDSLTIGDDIFAIINEFSAVAGGRYGEVDARSLRNNEAYGVSRPPSRYPPPSSRSPAMPQQPSPQLNQQQQQQQSDARRSWLIAALRTSQDEDDLDDESTSVSTPAARPDSSLIGSPFGSPPLQKQQQKHPGSLPSARQQQQQSAALAAAAGLLNKQTSFASTNGRTSGRSADEGGRHTAARARAWASRQRDRMMSAFSNDRGGNRRSQTSLAGSARSKPSEDREMGASFEYAGEGAPQRLRLMQHSLSTSNVSAPVEPTDPRDLLMMPPPPSAHRFGRAPSAASFR
ncbi:Myosin type-2 heavy chain 1 [Coemansia erecta]|uniref:Myosin type-2 heavy chain 1 n=1 Tax=Coemansia erecta TaxID=147472 RepID=A0A9W7XZB2_9FUNG|nr:Myosin type-2 heavy chain 1 [Coemansia erecta]